MPPPPEGTSLRLPWWLRSHHSESEVAPRSLAECSRFIAHYVLCQSPGVPLFLCEVARPRLRTLLGPPQSGSSQRPCWLCPLPHAWRAGSAQPLLGWKSEFQTPGNRLEAVEGQEDSQPLRKVPVLPPLCGIVGDIAKTLAPFSCTISPPPPSVECDALLSVLVLALNATAP